VQHLAAISRNPNQLDLFACGPDGRVYTSWWTAGHDWSGLNDHWRNIGGIFPPGAPVAAVSRNPNQLDLFICSNDGRVYTSWWTAGQDWSGLRNRWRNIGGIFPPGPPVTAITFVRPSLIAGTGDDPGLSLFVCGSDGRVYTSWWIPGQDWSGVNDHWRNIGGIFPPGAPVAAVSRSPGQLDLFICGNDGRVHTSWQTPGQAQRPLAQHRRHLPARARWLRSAAIPTSSTCSSAAMTAGCTPRGGPPGTTGRGSTTTGATSAASSQ
jgi:hypothetical protein